MRFADRAGTGKGRLNQAMQRVLSTYLFVNRKLTAAVVEEMASAGISAIELFCSRGHFDYRSAEDAGELRSWLDRSHLRLHSIHAPTLRDFDTAHESATPLSISDPERVRRQEAVDETKRAMDLVEQVPFRTCVLHVGRPRDVADPRRWDAAFSSLEHLLLFARHRGITLALENTPGEMATPLNLKGFLEETRLGSLKLCFDTGHAHLGDGVVAGLDAVRDLIVTTHVHDNRGERDEHLLPYQGTIDWNAALAALPPEAPVVLELKEPPAAAANSDLQVFAEKLLGARDVFEKFERTLEQA